MQYAGPVLLLGVEKNCQLVGVLVPYTHRASRCEGDLHTLHFFHNCFDFMAVEIHAINNDDVLCPPGDGETTVA